MTQLRLAVGAWLLVTAPGHLARAACNAIPERPPVFRGAVGSIDRPFVSPDRDEVVTLTLQTSPAAEALGQRADVRGLPRITLFFKPPRQTAKIFSIASKKGCEPAEERVCPLRRLFCHVPKPSCISPKIVGETVSVEGGVQTLRFRFPDTGAAGPVSIAVTDANQPFPDALRAETCDDLVRSASRPDLSVCIDQFQPIDDPPGDPTFLGLVALPSSYDYRTECSASVGKPDCLGTAKDIAYTVNSEGDVLMPVRWANILRAKNQSGDFDQRLLLASTAVEAVDVQQGQGNRIFIPSAAFLETTTQQGGGFSPSPDFVPLELPTTRPNEQTFSGTADKGKSVLKFARRKLWAYTCNGGVNQAQACEPDWAGADCPSAQCVASTAAYFACASGSRDKLPCTRTAHCPGGTCQLVSKTGSVCVLFDGTQTATACTQDSNCRPRCLPLTSSAGSGRVCVAFDGAPTGTACKKDSDCPTTAECGPGLFEVRTRITNGLGTLTRIATGARGVCDSGSQAGAVCTGSSMCGDSANCVAYRAAALTYTTPLPTATP
jgi:hypothetical protein